MKPSERREHEKAALRELILNTARTLFASEGFDQVTMRRIAEEIGYSATTLYLYFPDKISLMKEICEVDFQALSARFGEAVAAQARAACPVDKLLTTIGVKAPQPRDPVDLVCNIGQAYVRFAREHPHHYRLMFMTKFKDSEAQALMEGKEAKRQDPAQNGYALLVAHVQLAADAGRLRSEYNDVQLVSQLLWAALHGVISLQLTKGNDPWVPWVDFELRINAMLNAQMHSMFTPPYPNVFPTAQA